MKIGHYDHQVWSKGGLASYIRRVAAAQRKQGHEVFFFSKKPSVTCSTEEEIIVPNNAELFRVAKKHGIDILHTHRALELPPPQDLAVIRTVHGHAPYCPSGSRFLAASGVPCDRSYNPVGCLISRFTDRCGSMRPQKIEQGFRETHNELTTLQNIPIIAVSEFIKSQLLQAGYPPENLHVLHLFAPIIQETPSLPQESENPRFVFLGRICEEKGIRWLLNAVSSVPEPIHLDVAGDGYLLAEMKVLAEKLKINDRVVFHGWVTPLEVNRLIADSRALIFPSIWHEPGGTVAFEAMGAARAVIMSRVGGMPEVIIDHEDGLLIEPNDVQQLAHAMSCLATNLVLATKIGKTGYYKVQESFTQEQHMQKLYNLYETVLEKKQVSEITSTVCEGVV